MLSALETAGNRIVRSGTGEPVVLRGVNRSGLEYSSPEPPGSLARASIGQEELDAITGWGANLIRLPFNQEWALGTPTYDAEPYLEALDFVIEAADARGAYTLLDLQWLNAREARGTLGNGRPNFVAPLPNEDSILVWQQLACRYRERSSVLFDLFNEPHDALSDDPVPLQAMDAGGRLVPARNRRVRAREWQPWATYLIDVIRREHPGALVFVSGIDWGYDLEGFSLPAANNVVYSSHVYPNKRKRWDRAFGDLARRVPVFVGELGGQDGDLAWGERLLEYLEERCIGWAAWSWSDHPHLIQAASTQFEPTLFGHLIRDALGPNRRT